MTTRSGLLQWPTQLIVRLSHALLPIADRTRRHSRKERLKKTLLLILKQH